MSKWLLFYECRWCGQTFSEVFEEGLTDEHTLTVLTRWAQESTAVLHHCGPSPEDREVMRRGIADPVGFRKAWPDEEV